MYVERPQHGNSHMGSPRGDLTWVLTSAAVPRWDAERKSSFRCRLFIPALPEPESRTAGSTPTPNAPAVAQLGFSALPPGFEEADLQRRASQGRTRDVSEQCLHA